MFIHLVSIRTDIEKTAFWLPTLAAFISIGLARLASRNARDKSKSVKTRRKNIVSIAINRLPRPLAKRCNRILRRLNRLSKSYTRSKRAFTKKARRVTKNLGKLFKQIRLKKVATLGFTVLISLMVGISLGAIFSHRISSGITEATGYFSKQSSEAPNPASTLGPAQTNTAFSKYPSWSQNFATDTSGKLNANYWEVYQGPADNSNNEAEYYTDSPTNLFIKNGVLTLQATHQQEPGDYNYASAKIDTNGKVSFLYGRIDVTAEMPAGIGTWPAVWFLPANNKYEDLSPASDSTRYLNGGEIDLIESVGIQQNLEYGIVHTLSDALTNPNGVGSYNTLDVANNNTSYYQYTLLWTPDTITFEVNGQPFYSYSRQPGANYTTWPFDQPFYMILNLALGGTWGGEDSAQFPPNGIDNSALPSAMNIKSIYYYPYTNTGQ